MADRENPNVYRIFGKDWTAENCYGKELDCNYQTEFVTREFYEQEIEMLKTKLSMCKDKYYMLVNSCEWYADKGTEQERHHFLKVEALGNYEADMQEIDELK